MATHYKVFECTGGNGRVTYAFPCNAGGTVNTDLLNGTLQVWYAACVAGTMDGLAVTAHGVMAEPTEAPRLITAPA
jgi:hypothetical protein